MVEREALFLRQTLVDILGSQNVYFQPPESIKLSYPCIIYSLSNAKKFAADNKRYLGRNRYEIMVIDKDPYSDISEKVQELPYCSFDRAYTADNLNHYVHTIYL